MTLLPEPTGTSGLELTIARIERALKSQYLADAPGYTIERGPTSTKLILNQQSNQSTTVAQIKKFKIWACPANSDEFSAYEVLPYPSTDIDHPDYADISNFDWHLSTTSTRIAKPWLLRPSVKTDIFGNVNGNSARNSFAYTYSEGGRTATYSSAVGGAYFTEEIYPFYAVDDWIIAINIPGMCGIVNVDWLDMNVDGRVWRPVMEKTGICFNVDNTIKYSFVQRSTLFT